MSLSSSDNITIFISYSHKDENLAEEVKKFLGTLKQQKLISTWHDRQILPGQEWEHEISQNLEVADIVLLLISQDFINSEYCWGVELKRAMERHEAGDAHVIPVSLRPTDWEGMPFKKLQALPKEGKPITRWDDQEEALLDFSKGIRKVVEEILSQKQVAKSHTSLKATVSNNKSTVIFCAHVWSCQQYDCECDAEINWTDVFRYQSQIQKTLPSSDIWEGEEGLLSDLNKAKYKLTSGHTGLTIDLRGRLPLTVALAIGMQFPGVAYTIQTEQYNQQTRQAELWRSDARGSENNPDMKFEVAHQQGNPGPNILIAIDVGRMIWPQVSKLYSSEKYSFDSVVHLKSKNDSLRTDADATALADDVVYKINHYRKLNQAECVHLLMACPQGLAVFLGQQLRLFSRLVTYEHQPAVEEQYITSFSL